MKRPNILLLYTDQLRWDALGVNGNPDVLTPHLDQLAQDGLNFDHYFVQNPVCMPSRVSFLSGQYPGTLGITHMGVPVPETTPTLPQFLKNYGYRSANIGKLHFLPHANHDHRQMHPRYGFDHLEISDEPGCYKDAYFAWVARKAPDQLEKISCGLPPARELWDKAMGATERVVHPPLGRREHFTRAFASRSDLTHTAFVADQTMEFVRHNADQAFFCVAGFYSPHSPWIAPQEFLDLYEPQKLSLPSAPPEFQNPLSDAEIRQAQHGYYAMISELDHHVGRILDQLQQLGLRDDTLVVFTSDHGEWLGEHGRYGKGYPGHDCVSRVPFLVRWPSGMDSPGRNIHELVEAVDFVPTVLESAGIPIPQELQGHSLYSYLSGKSTPPRTSALMEERDWKSLRTTKFRYLARANGEEALFDLSHEFGEYYNVSDKTEYSLVLAELRKQLLCRLIERERPIPRTWSY